MIRKPNNPTPFAIHLNKLCDSHPDIPSLGMGRQTHLAKMLGVSQEAVRKWLDGQSEPRRKKMQNLADALNVSFSYLVCPEDDNFRTNSMKQISRKNVQKKVKTKSDDMVNSPDHYNAGSVETIDSIKSALGDERFQGYLAGNIIKYACRFDKKGKPIEDLKKMIWYTNRLIEELQ